MLEEILYQKGLSNREVEVAKLVAQGCSNKQAADKLFVTEKTVKFHLTNIYRKMQIKSRSQLIVFCLPKLGFIENNETAKNADNEEKPAETDGIPVLPRSFAG